MHCLLLIKSPELPGKSALTGINARTDLCASLGVARVLGLGAGLFYLARSRTLFRFPWGIINLGVVHRTDAISKIHQKQIWVIDLHLWGDAAHTPVLDPLSATFLIVETVGELSRAAEAVDDLAIGVNAIFAHGVY